MPAPTLLPRRGRAEISQFSVARVMLSVGGE
jgi:hypothetical protein